MDILGLLAIAFYAALFLVIIFFAFLPSIIARRKEHDDFLWILVANVVLGGTVFGWFLALIWACHPDWTLERMFG
jgi:hypothetical protein